MGRHLGNAAICTLTSPTPTYLESAFQLTGCLLSSLPSACSMLRLCGPTRLEAWAIRKSPSLPQGPWCEVILPLRCSGSSRAPEMAGLGCHSAKALLIALASYAPQQHSALSPFREGGHLPTLLASQSLEGKILCQVGLEEYI